MPNKTRAISHIGILVHDADAATRLWTEAFGFQKFNDLSIEVEGIRSVFLSPGGTAEEMTIEIMEPLDKSDMENALLSLAGVAARTAFASCGRTRPRCSSNSTAVKTVFSTISGGVNPRCAAALPTSTIISKIFFSPVTKCPSFAMASNLPLNPPFWSPTRMCMARSSSVRVPSLYFGGFRVGEVVALRWQDVQAREDGGQVTVSGKGGKTRSVRIYNGAWKRLSALRHGASAEGAVIASRKGNRAVSAVQVHRIVRAAAAHAGIEARVSAHWLRHAHASHALDRGAPAHLVRDTLGHANIATASAYAHARPDQSSSRFLAS